MCLADPARTATTTQLLDSLLDESNETVWVGFDARYRPIIFGVARRLGLPPEDAADVAQETLAQFVRDYRRGLYQRGKGSLRAWILTIARHRAIDVLRARGRAQERACGDQKGDSCGDEALASAWEAEEERAIFHAALQELRDTSRADPLTLRLFELTAIHGLSNGDAARECGVEVDRARLAKHRLTTRLGELVERITGAYRTDG